MIWNREPYGSRFFLMVLCKANKTAILTAPLQSFFGRMGLKVQGVQRE